MKFSKEQLRGISAIAYEIVLNHQRKLNPTLSLRALKCRVGYQCIADTISSNIGTLVNKRFVEHAVKAYKITPYGRNTQSHSKCKIRDAAVRQSILTQMRPYGEQIGNAVIMFQ